MKRFFSDTRISAYIDEAEYIENIRVSMALYPVLHVFEVVLRNKIDAAMKLFLRKRFEIILLITEMIHNKEIINPDDIEKFCKVIQKPWLSKYKSDFIGIKLANFDHYKERIVKLAQDQNFIATYDSNWLVDLHNDAQNLIIKGNMKKKISEAVDKIGNKLITNDNILSNVSLGFWVDLLNDDYFFKENEINQTKFFEKIFIRRINNNEIAKIIADMHKIRKCRNRVSHYQKILNHSGTSLDTVKITLVQYLKEFDDTGYLNNFIQQFD